MSSSSDSELEATITQKIAQKKSKSPKKKKKSSAPVVPGHVRNEGDDPRWAYEPPKDAQLLDHAVDAGEFEWKAIKDDEDTEIWLIRAPDSIKSKHLDGLEIDLPLSSRTARVGAISKKSGSYDIWSLGDDDAEVVGGEELRGLSCLLPREKKGGRLYIAPKRVSRHMVISAQPPIATPPEHQSIICQNPPRRAYSKNVLKHEFVPYGARSESHIQPANVPMGADDNDIEVEKPQKPRSHRDQSSKIKPESKGRKRKVEVELSKGSKKHKASA